MNLVFKSLAVYGLLVLSLLAFPAVGPGIVGAVASTFAFILLLSLLLPKAEGYKAVVDASRKVSKHYLFSSVLHSTLSQVGSLVLLYMVYVPGQLSWPLLALLAYLLSHAVVSGKVSAYQSRLIDLKY